MGVGEVPYYSIKRLEDQSNPRGFKDLVLSSRDASKDSGDLIWISKDRHEQLHAWKTGLPIPAKVDAPREFKGLSFHMSSTGLGDAICGYYAACGLADATRQPVNYYAHSWNWFGKVQHPLVKILERRPIGHDISPFNEYPDRIYNHPSFTAAYTSKMSKVWNVPAFSAKRPRDIRNDPKTLRPKTVVISPLSCFTSREWNKWTDLTKALQLRGYSVVGVGSSDQKSRLDGLFAGTDAKIMAGASPDEVQETMLSADFIIGNDSGIVHLGGLLGLPTIAVHAGALPHSFLYDRAPTVVSVLPDISVARGDHNTDALHSITVDKVLKTVDSIGNVKRLEGVKGCNCAKHKEALNNFLPGLGDAVAVVANPIASILNKTLGTNLGS